MEPAPECPEMQTAVTTRAAMEESFRQAILNKHFALHYQAQVTAQGRLSGAEDAEEINREQRHPAKEEAVFHRITLGGPIPPDNFSSAGFLSIDG